jgi:hypothetical protein
MDLTICPGRAGNLPFADAALYLSDSRRSSSFYFPAHRNTPTDFRLQMPGRSRRPVVDLS